MSRFWLLGAAALGVAAMAADAQAQDEAAFRAEMIARCSTIHNKSARNACYDAANRGPGSAPARATAAPPTPALTAPAVRAAPPAATAAAPPASSRIDAFGAEEVKARAPRPAEPKQTQQIEARVVAATDDGGGYWQVTLEGGARWKMIERDSSFRPPRPDQLVRIRKGAMGGYMMAVDRQAYVRVERID